jgi:hypothetical protein
MPSLLHALIGLGPFANQGYKIVFDKTSVTVYHPNGHTICNGWRNIDGPQLWQFPLTTPPSLPAHSPPLAPLAGGISAAMAAGLPHPSKGFRATSAAGENIQVEFLQGGIQSMAMAAHASSTPYNPQTLDLPSINALVSFYHACLGFPVKQMWLDTIKASNCGTFDGLTYSKMARYCPDCDDTILGHLAQQHRNVRSTKPKCPTPLLPAALPTAAPGPKDMPPNQVFIKVYPLSRLYTDDTGRFPIRARSGNQYIMIAFHADGNLILQQTFKSKSDRHQIAAYNAIMTCLAARGLSVDLQILDNKASAEYKEAITSSGMQNSNLSHRICIAGIELNVLFTLSRTSSWKFFPASTPPFHHTCGTFFYHRLNSPSIFSIRPISIQGLVCGNFSKGYLTSTRRHLVRLVVGYSSMQSRLLGNCGTSMQNQASILAMPSIPTTASS